MNLRQQQFQDMLNTSDPTMGTIYFLLSVDGPNSKVKIGRTGNINEFSQTRLKQLQVGNANKLILIGFLKGRETYYQIKFEEYWIRGEWFDFHKMKDKLYNLLSDELEYIVKRIKKRPQTTRNSYGDYLNQIIELHKITSLNHKLIADLLKMAGGSSNGINDAMKIINL